MTDQVAMMPAAIIGMACRFPGAPDLRTYWDLLLGGREGVADYVGGRTAELDAFYGAAGSDLGAPSGRGGFVEGIEHFDADFFGISPREAEFIDPQQRILLELAWEALEDAGLAVERLAGPRTGVFIGVWTGDYERQIDLRAAVADIRSTVCNALFGASGRLAAAFDFRGPELSINSGCASSLVAINQAIAALRSGQCDVALVGGANAVIRPEITQAFGRAGVLSPDGRCKFGDASANGFVRSDGAGMLVLKRLGQACADGDRIRACIRGSAVNNNGSSSGFLTRPSEVGQAEVIVSALADANVSPADIAYVEAHGTGTAVGDPIEISALAAVLGRHPDRTEPCLVGSAKSNIGHTEAAAGMAGVIKTVLALEHRHLPPTLHVNTPNPAVDWSRAGVALNTVGRPWPGSEPRLAGVSAFGVTGSNAHVILQEAPAAKPLDPTSPALAPRSAWALPLSAHSPEALATLALAYADALDARSDLADICFTAATRRSSLPYRLVAVSDDAAALTTRLRTWAKEGTAAFVVTGHDQAESATRPVMVFPGQGSQWDGMGRELMAREPVFHAAIMRCDAAVQAEVGWSVRQRLLDGAGLERAGIEVIQPILFSIQVALAELWSRWGVKPAVLVGHSMGEVAAAHVAGALSLEHAARIICRRSALMTRFSGQGAMMLAELSLDEAAEAIAGHEGEVSIAAANGPRSTVFAGEPAAVHAVASKLQSAGVFTRSVAVQVAAHSPQMGLIRYELQQSLGDVRPKAGSVPIYSTTLGRLTDGAEFDAAYWAKNLRQPVLFHPALKALMANGQQTFIEVSPHPILVPSIEETAREAGVEALTLASLRRNEPEQANMLAAFGTLFVRRFPVDWSGIYPTGRIADLPGHPWRRQRYWPDNDNAPQVSLTAGGHPLLPPPFKTAEHSWVWTSRLSTETLPWLKDHSVRGTTLLPASAYVEIAIVAARQIIGQAKVQVHNLRLIEAIVLSHEQTLQVMATAERPGRWSIKIHVRNGSPDNWTVAATGVVTTDPDIELEPLPVDQVGGFQAGAPADAVTGEAHANDLFRLGYDFGPNFLNLRWIDLAGDALRAEALLSDQLRTTAYGLHPALLDAGFQVVAAGLLRRRSQREVLIPQSIGRARLFPAAASAAVAYIQADIEPQGLSGNLRLFNADGAPVAEVLGLRFQAFASTGDTSETGLLHGLDWVPAEAVSPQASPRTWLVLPDVGGEGVAFAAAMRRLGVTADVIEPTRADRFGVRDGTLQRRLAPRMVSPGELGVVSFASLDLPADASTEMIAANGAELTELATFLADIAGTSLCFVTRGACAVDPGQPVSVPQASVWGLGAVIANEVPELSCRLIDLAPDGGPQTDSLAAEMLSGSSEPRIALRADRRLVARLRVRHGDTPSGFSRSLQPHERAEIVVGTPGMLDTLSISRARRSAPATGEVEIEVHAAGMNFLDVIRAMGLFDPLAGRIPKLGAECAGRVVRVGDGVTGVKVGDRVVALSPAFQDVATFTSHLIVPAALTASVPASLSFAQAAALPCVYLTSYFALVEAARVRPGETVLIHSGTGGVGLSAIHVARWLGAKVIASAGSEEKRALLRSLGIEGVFELASARVRQDGGRADQWPRGGCGAQRSGRGSHPGGACRAGTVRTLHRNRQAGHVGQQPDRAGRAVGQPVPDRGRPCRHHGAAARTGRCLAAHRNGPGRRRHLARASSHRIPRGTCRGSLPVDGGGEAHRQDGYHDRCHGRDNRSSRPPGSPRPHLPDYRRTGRAWSDRRGSPCRTRFTASRAVRSQSTFGTCIEDHRRSSAQGRHGGGACRRPRRWDTAPPPAR